MESLNKKVPGFKTGRIKSLSITEEEYNQLSRKEIRNSVSREWETQPVINEILNEVHSKLKGKYSKVKIERAAKAAFRLWRLMQNTGCYEALMIPGLGKVELKKNYVRFYNEHAENSIVEVIKERRRMFKEWAEGKRGTNIGVLVRKDANRKALLLDGVPRIYELDKIPYTGPNKKQAFLYKYENAVKPDNDITK